MMIMPTQEQQKLGAARAKHLHDQLRDEGMSELEISLIGGCLLSAALGRLPVEDRAALACGHIYAMLGGIVRP